jgi:hypothetical protein
MFYALGNDIGNIFYSYSTTKSYYLNELILEFILVNPLTIKFFVTFFGDYCDYCFCCFIYYLSSNFRKHGFKIGNEVTRWTGSDLFLTCVSIYSLLSGCIFYFFYYFLSFFKVFCWFSSNYRNYDSDSLSVISSFFFFPFFFLCVLLKSSICLIKYFIVYYSSTVLIYISPE